MADVPDVAADAALSNADAAAAALAKSAHPQADKPNVDPAREAELDSALDAVLAETNPDGQGPKDTPAPEPTEVEKAATAEAERKAEEARAKAAEAQPEEQPKKKGPLDNLLAPDKPEAKPAAAPDETDEIKLRSDASPKTRETFEQLKTTYKARVDVATQRANELEARVKELEGKIATVPTVPPELEAEVKELRSFRAQFDTENDPTFKSKFDAKLEANYNDIYAKLTDHGLPAADLANLKGLPPAERDVEIDGLLTKLEKSPASKRFIEAKLIDNQAVLDQRKKELAEARANADTILKQKAQEPQVNLQQRVEGIGKILKPIIANLPWMHTKDIPATAGPEEKKALEAANAFALETQGYLKTAVLDDSIESRANAAIALPLAHHYKAQLDILTPKYDAVVKELNAIKAASRTSRTAQTAAKPAPAGGQPAAVDTTKTSGDRVDDLFAQVQAESSGRL